MTKVKGRQQTLLALAALLAQTCCWALDSDRNEPISIEAAAARINERTGTSVYEGKVTITQGTLRVTADLVEVRSQGKEVVQLVAKAEDDRLAHYEQQTNAAGDMVYADAKQITYLVQEDMMQLSGQARLQQAKDVFSGEQLRYDLAAGVVDLAADEATGGRVQMTIDRNRKSN